jgi:hypothetical protein
MVIGTDCTGHTITTTTAPNKAPGDCYLYTITTKTGRHDIAEIMLKVALSTINQINQIKSSDGLVDCNI